MTRRANGACLLCPWPFERRRSKTLYGSPSRTAADDGRLLRVAGSLYSGPMTRPLAILGLAAAVTAAPVAQSGSKYGGDSPQAVIAALQQPVSADDLAAAIPFIAPAGRREIALEAVGGVAITLGFTNPDVVVPGQPPPPKAELDRARKNYRAAQDLVRTVLAPHRLDFLIGQSAEVMGSPANEHAIVAAIEKTDTVVLIRALMTALPKLIALLDLPASNTRKVPFSFRTVTNYRVSGDRATATAGSETLEFERIDGRWFLRVPKQD